MNKVAIITLMDNLNYGNRLQNYALSSVISDFGYNVFTLKMSGTVRHNLKITIKKYISLFKYYVFNYRDNNYYKLLKSAKCETFNKKYINIYSFKNYNDINKANFEKFVVGSDQILSPIALKYYPHSLTPFANNSKSVVFYAPSIGVSKVDDNYISTMKKFYSNDKVSDVSAREKTGISILEKVFNDKKIELVIDPTLLLSFDEWNSIMKKPTSLKSKKYILLYFLGNMLDTVFDSIKNVAIKYDCDIINIMDVNGGYFDSDPTEFLYLERNAFLICTDSFHSSVFGFVFDRPFVVFDRSEKLLPSMSSRIDNFLDLFKLNNRRFNGKEITLDNLNHNYDIGFKILERERKKSKNFLKKGLEKQ